MATKRSRPGPRRIDEAPAGAELEMIEMRVYGPAGEIRDVPVVRPGGEGPHDAPTLRRLQTDGRATRATGSLLEVAVKRGGSGHPLSDKLAKLRRD